MRKSMTIALSCILLGWSATTQAQEIPEASFDESSSQRKTDDAEEGDAPPPNLPKTPAAPGTDEEKVVPEPALPDTPDPSDSKDFPAAPSSVDSTPKPWAQGISKEAQTLALASFQEGNSFFAHRQHAQALRYYGKALEHWPHPAIHFNTAVCQINLDQPILAFKNMTLALKYGEAALGEELYARGLTYHKLLKARLGQLVINSKEAGARVTLDGEQVLDGPGKHEQILLPGKHEVVAEKEGYLTFAQSVEVAPGEPTTIEIRMVSLEDATVYERPMPVWLPWTLMGAGLLMGGGGVGMRAVAAGKLKDYDRGIANECPDGCRIDEVPEELERLKVSARTWDIAALGTMGTGAAVLVTGVTLLVLNSPRPVRTEMREVAGFTMLPTAPDAAAGLSFSGAF